jgi:hypothetical protein
MMLMMEDAAFLLMHGSDAQAPLTLFISLMRPEDDGRCCSRWAGGASVASFLPARATRAVLRYAMR